jgi:hypothetical protein
LKYVIDVTLFVTLSSIAGLGLMLAFIIPRGLRVEGRFL